jgi:hypothetical protein
MLCLFLICYTCLYQHTFAITGGDIFKSPLEILQHLNSRQSNEFSTIRQALVLRRSTLARLKLLQIPSTDLHVAVVLIEAFGKLLGVGFTAAGAGLVTVCIALRSSGVVIHAVCLGLLLSRRGGATAEERADTVSNG